MASQPDGSTDRSTDQMTNKPINRHWSSILPINRSQTNKPTTRPAKNSNHQPSIHLSDRPPTNQPEEVLTSNHCLILHYGDSMFLYPHFCLADCMVVDYLQCISDPYKRTLMHLVVWSAPSDSHLNPFFNHKISQVRYLTHARKSLVKFGALFT